MSCSSRTRKPECQCLPCMQCVGRPVPRRDCGVLVDDPLNYLRQQVMRQQISAASNPLNVPYKPGALLSDPSFTAPLDTHTFCLSGGQAISNSVPGAILTPSGRSGTLQFFSKGAPLVEGTSLLSLGPVALVDNSGGGVCGARGNPPIINAPNFRRQ